MTFTSISVGDYDGEYNFFYVIVRTGSDISALSPQTTVFSLQGGNQLVDINSSPYTVPSSTTTTIASTTSSTPPEPTSSPTTSPTTPTSTPAPITNSGLSSSTKVGLGVGISLGVICLILLAAFILLLRRHRTRKAAAHTTEPSYGIEGVSGYGTDAEAVVVAGEKNVA